jgi:hypothetical protein
MPSLFSSFYSGPTFKHQCNLLLNVLRHPPREKSEPLARGGGEPCGAEAAEAVPRYEGLHFFRSPNNVRGKRGFPQEPLVPTEALCAVVWNVEAERSDAELNLITTNKTVR